MSHANTLAQQQRDLLQAIFTANNIAAQAANTLAIGLKHPLNSHSIRGLQAYQANAAASAQRSLQTAYPVIAQLIGSDAFEHLSRDYWARHPPTYGDLAQWGGELAEFIASISELQTEPYLSDVAKAEWALHLAATAADSTVNFTSFSLLTTQDADNVTLQLAPGAVLISSNYPIASLLTAHLYKTFSLEDVGTKLRANCAESALIWRQGFRPTVSVCNAVEAAFVRKLLSGKSMLKALETQPVEQTNLTQEEKLEPAFDLSTWLTSAVQDGLVVGVQVL